MNSLKDELLELGGDITEALESVTLPATLLDTNGVIRWQNSASLAFRGSHVGADFSELVAPDEQPDARALITSIFCQGEPAELTLHVLNADGGYTQVQLSAVPVREGGAVVAIFGVGYIADPTRRAATPVAGSSLTGRQLDVLRLLADGASTDEIATALTLSPITVRNHIANLMAALGVHSRLAAVVAANKTGLLDPQSS